MTRRRRAAKPALSPAGEQALAEFEHYLTREQDLAAPTVRNYLSDMRQFACFCEGTWGEGVDEDMVFIPEVVATPVITRYRAHLQTVEELKPKTINRHLVTIKRYFAWASDTGQVQRDPAKPVKLVDEVVPPPRNLSDQEEARLIAAVTQLGTPRDRTLLVFMLHSGLRAQEVGRLRPDDVRIGKRSGALRVHGKRNKYRDVPLNATAREAYEEYQVTWGEKPPANLFPSEKTGGRLTQRAIGYIVKKYAKLAKVTDLSPHDLRHRFGYRMAAENVPLHRLAEIMGHDSLDTTMIYIRGTQQDLQKEVEKIAWA